MMINNRLKRALKEGKVVIGTFIASAAPEFVEIIGISGFDFVVIDTEHGPLSLETTGNLIRAAELRGLTPIIRIRENSETMILRALDIGAHGVQIPQIRTKGDADNAVQWAKYHPVGKRGVAMPRAIDFGVNDLLESYRISNEETMLVVNCESEEGYNNLDEILSVPEIDVLFLGPFDMSQSFGLPLQFGHPKMIEVVDEFCRKTKNAGKIAGIHTATAEQAKLRAKQGFQYISIQMFETLVAKACKDVVDEFNRQ
jgi:4-hydroxy-2-oxoheptanedioate aldolase